jgi:hypothetical protein
MEPRLTRRTVLRGALATVVTGIATAALLGYRARRVLDRPSALVLETLYDQLRQRTCAWLPRARAIAVYFSYLDIPDEVLTRFFDDYDRAEEARMLTPLPLDIYGRFLMSTDFFPGGADETRALAYLAFYDPRVSPCYNPLQTR